MLSVLSGPYSWAEQTLLLYCNQLPEKWAWRKDAAEPAQKEMDWWIDLEEVWYPFKNKWADCSGMLYSVGWSRTFKNMLMQSWVFSMVCSHLCSCVKEMLNLAIKYNKAVQEEDELPPEKLAIANVGRQDAKKHLEEHVSNLMSSNIVQTLGTMLDTVVF
jgi:hypothetical protein